MRQIAIVSLVACLVACESPARVVGTQNSQNSQNSSSDTPPAGIVATLQPITDTAGLVVGAARLLWVEAYDDRSNHVSTDQAVVRSSNSSVVQVAEARLVSMTDPRGRAWKELHQV